MNAPAVDRHDAASRTDALHCSYAGHPPLLAGSARDCLASHFRILRDADVAARANAGSTRDVRSHAALAPDVVRTIIDTARARAITAAAEANRRALEVRVARCLHANVPIAAYMIWSPRKHWVHGDESSVDLAELAALDTLHSIHAAVRAIHPPGMAFQLDVEDLQFEFIEGPDPAARRARNSYVEGMRRLVDVLDARHVFGIGTFSDRAADAAELAAWRARLAENFRALEAYWHDSENADPAGNGRLASFAALCRLGWIGAIPAEMRRHYLSRLRNVPDPDRRVALVLKNFAGILLHRQIGAVPARDGIEPIKFSFVPPAQGAPAELLTGRIDLRFVHRRVTSRIGAAGPWSTKGFLHESHARLAPAFVGWHQAGLDGARYAPGRFTLARGGRSADVRADYLPASSGR